MVAGFHRHAHLQAGIRGVHVHLELRITLRIAGKILGRRHALRFAADCESLQQHAVQPKLELMGLAQSDDVVVLLPAQQNLDRVLRVEREMIANQGAALRSKRQVVAHTLVLHERFRNLERVDHRLELRIADREAADGAGRRQIILEKKRRHRQHARNVVEPFLVGFICRKQRFAVDLEPD